MLLFLRSGTTKDPFVAKAEGILRYRSGMGIIKPPMLGTHKNFKHLPTITGLFVAVLIISNIASTKLSSFWGLTLDAGTVLFPLSYIFSDVLTEVYGFARARRVIWTGFAGIALASLTFYLVQLLPVSPDWPNQGAYEAILGLVPRIVAGSLTGYFCGEFANSYVLAKMKVATQGKWLWSRTIGSTLIGQLVDTLVFSLIAFYGSVPGSVFVALVISNYVFKTAVEVVFTPVTYAITKWLKKAEDEDYYDKDTDFNPFKVA